MMDVKFVFLSWIWPSGSYQGGFNLNDITFEQAAFTPFKIHCQKSTRSKTPFTTNLQKWHFNKSFHICLLRDTVKPLPNVMKIIEISWLIQIDQTFTVFFQTPPPWKIYRLLTVWMVAGVERTDVLWDGWTVFVRAILLFIVCVCSARTSHDPVASWMNVLDPDLSPWLRSWGVPQGEETFTQSWHWQKTKQTM